MQTHHDELRDELVAILGASRELTAETDSQLADAFMHYLEERQKSETAHASPVEAPHQPHYSLTISGAAWGAALMFLFLLLVLDNPSPGAFITASVVLLSLVWGLTRVFLAASRAGWRVARLRITVAPPNAHDHR